MLNTTRKWTTVDAAGGRKLAVRVSGERGLPFIWGHALQASMRVDEDSGVFDWRGIGPARRIIRYDARAHGESCSESDPRACAWQSLARDMWRVADDCDAEVAVLGGASMGCATALWAATQHPARVAGLVLVIPPTAWELRARQARSYLMMARLVRLTGNLPFRAATMMLGSGPSGSPLRSIAREVVRGLANRDPGNIEVAFRGAALSDLPSLRRCAALDMPALILAWRNDPSHPASVAARLAEALPNARLELAEDDAAIRRWPGAVNGFLHSIRRVRRRPRKT